MQKMTNILLAGNKAESKPSSEIKQANNDKNTSENSDFSTALQQASVESKKQTESNEKVSVKADGEGAKSEPAAIKSDLATTQVEEAQFESQKKNGSGSDELSDVSHVLAQINLATQLSNADKAASAVMVMEGGDNLPPEDIMLDKSLMESLSAQVSGEVDQEQILLDPKTTEPLDEKTLTELLNKSGLTQKELVALPPETLAQLITLVKNGGGNHQEFLDVIKPVEILAADAVVSHQDLNTKNKMTGAEVAYHEQTLAGTASEKERLQGKTPATVVTEPLITSQIKQEQINKEVSATASRKAQLSSIESKGISISGQEPSPKDEAVKLNTILGDKRISPAEVISTESKQLTETISTNNKLQAEIGLSDSKPLTEIISSSNKPIMEGQIAAEQQLKGAEFSIKLTPMKAGAELSVAFTESASGVEAKQQATSVLSPQQSPRSDMAQIHLSLKQSNEQQVQMQDMIQRFSPVMKQQLITMVSQGMQHAEIRLDPPELGQLMVRIQVQGDQTQVQFQVAQHQTRDLIEQAIPRLKELLSEQGMQLTDSQVSQDDREDGAEGDQGSEDNGGQLGSDLDELSSEELLISSKETTGYQSVVDYYA